MSQQISNVVNRLLERVRNIESAKKYYVQNISDVQLLLEEVDNLEEEGIRMFKNISQVIYQKDIEVYNFGNILNIIVSASFILSVSHDSDYVIDGSTIMRILINNINVVENEIKVTNNGYSNISLNYNFEIEHRSLYTIVIEVESVILTDINEEINPSLNTRNNGISISLLII